MMTNTGCSRRSASRTGAW
uniref:Uncharacterized protein n=1 Tax=Arundo donax TaxID=35708 RepID=A0A0A9C8V0_ARUDO